MNWIRLILINLFVFVGMIIIAEISAGLIKLSIGRNFLAPDFGWLSNEVDPSDPCLEMKTDVMLHHVPNRPSECYVKNGIVLDDYVVYQKVSNTKPVLLTLGGSTTSGFYQHYSDGDTWPNYLSKLFSDQYSVVNGGIGGYSAQQEFLKFYMDGTRFKNISVVVSLNGINEQPNYFGRDYERSAFYPFSTQTQFRMNKAQKWIDQRVNANILSWSIWRIIPNIRSALINILYIDKNTISKSNSDLNPLFIPVSYADRWERNVRALEALVSLQGAKYFVFLQPTLGLEGPQSNPPRNTPDAQLLLELSDAYLDEMNDLYRQLRERCNKIDFCIDISDEVPPTGNVYYDHRHHNSQGNKMLANVIYSSLNNLLESPIIK